MIVVVVVDIDIGGSGGNVCYFALKTIGMTERCYMGVSVGVQMYLLQYEK